MLRQDQQRCGIHVDTQLPLLRAGLVRLAEDAGFPVVDAPDAGIWLTDHAETADGSICLTADDSGLTLRLRVEPSPEDWQALQELVQRLLA